MASLRKFISLLALIAIIFAVAWAAILPWRSQQLVEQIVAGTVNLGQVPDIWLADEPPRIAARIMLAEGPYLPEKVETYLKRSIRYRPLYAPTWADLADMAWRNGDTQLGLSYAEKARTLWPTRADLLFRLAVIHINLDAYNKAVDLLRDYVKNRPHDFDRAAHIAVQLIPSPEALVTAFLPNQENSSKKPGYFRGRLLAFAIANGRLPLASATWQVMIISEVDKSLGLRYFNFLVSKGKMRQAIDVFDSLSGNQTTIPSIHNGGFENPIYNGGLGWRANAYTHVTWARDLKDFYDGSYSLKLIFDGEANVQYHGVSQLIALEANKHYRISGFWKGEAVSTRSGVYVEVYGAEKGSQLRGRTDKKNKDWRWSEFAIDISTVDRAEFVVLRIRRDKTTALDRNISGSVWFDALEIEGIATVAGGR